MEVSIIVPVYNAEKTLCRCVESILNQEYKDLELILVDDGSTDSSGELCDVYAQKDERVRVFHRQKEGVSCARNCGIEAARGDYLQFADADDWVAVDATKLLVRAMKDNECDFVIADFYRVVGERISHKGDIEEDGRLTREEFADSMMDNPADFYYGVLWNKLFRTDIVNEHQLRMDANISWCEDFVFNLEYLLHVESVFALQAPVYYYVKTKGSLVSQGISIGNTVRMKMYVFEYYNEFYKNVYDEKDYEKRKRSLYRFFLESARDGIIRPSFIPGGKKLGEERIHVHIHDAMKEDIIISTYAKQRLLERYMETIALRYDMSLKEVAVLLYIYRIEDIDRKLLADYMGLSGRTISRILQKLSQRKMIELSGKGKQAQIHLAGKAQPVCRELDRIQNDYNEIQFQGFSEAERQEYLRLSEMAGNNIQKIWMN